MSEIGNCVYCGSPVDPSKPNWILERWEGGRCVARGAISNVGCLIATAHSQRPRDPDSVPITKGLLTRVGE